MDAASTVRPVDDRRLVAWAGILFFGWLIVAAVVYGGVLAMPTIASSAAYHRQYFTDHATAVLLHAWFSGLFWGFLFLIFATGLRRRLSIRGGEDDAIWPRLSTVGAVLAVAFGGTGLIFESVAAGVGADASDEMLRVLARMVQLVDATLLYWGLGVFVAAAGIAMLQSGRFGRGLAWWGFVSAAMMVVGALWPLSGDDRGPLALLGLIGLSLFGVWVLVTALTILRERASTEARTAVTAPTAS